MKTLFPLSVSFRLFQVAAIVGNINVSCKLPARYTPFKYTLIYVLDYISLMYRKVKRPTNHLLHFNKRAQSGNIKFNPELSLDFLFHDQITSNQTLNMILARHHSDAMLPRPKYLIYCALTLHHKTLMTNLGLKDRNGSGYFKSFNSSSTLSTNTPLTII